MNAAPLLDPTSKTYKNWFNGLSTNLSSTGIGGHKQQQQLAPLVPQAAVLNSHSKPPLLPVSGTTELQTKPIINSNSLKIVNQKRYGNTANSFGGDS